MRGSPASCAARRSRSRRCHSSAPATTSTNATSRSPPPRTARRPTRSPPSEALLTKAQATEDDLELGLQEGRPPRRSSTTAPASTPACSRSAARTAGRPRATACPTTPSSSVQQPPTTKRPKSTPSELPTRDRRLRRRHVRPPARAHGHAYARFEQLPEARDITDAMRAHPDLVGGPDGVDFHLMRTRAAGSQRAAPRASSAPPTGRARHRPQGRRRRSRATRACTRRVPRAARRRAPRPRSAPASRTAAARSSASCT